MSRSVLIGSVALAALTAFAASAAAGVPVTDSAVIAQSTKIAATTAEQLKRLNDIKKSTEDILNSIGQQGQALYDLGKNEVWQEFAGGGDMLKSLKEYAPNTCAIGGCAEGSGGEAKRFDDIRAARAYIMQNFYSRQIGSRADEADYRQARLNAEREANVSAYALAMVTRQYLAEAGERATKLDDLVNGADDLRADLRANSAVLLVQHAELTAMLAMLTSQLERDATAFLASEKDYISPEGGTTPPDVYHEGDYTADGIRIRVNGEGLPQSGQGGASLNDAIESMGGVGDLLQRASASGDSDLASAFERAAATFGQNGRAVALGAAGNAAGLDGNVGLQNAFNIAASRTSSGADVSSALFAGAASAAELNGNDSLRWLYQSAQYGMDTGDFETAVDVATGERPMIDVMFDVAIDMASDSDVPGGSDIVWAARDAYESGTMSAEEAVMVALEVATDATGDYQTADLVEAAIDVSKGGDPRDAILTVLDASGADGEYVDAVYDILYAADW